jgi:hypothetical protein
MILMNDIFVGRDLNGAINIGDNFVKSITIVSQQPLDVEEHPIKLINF